MAAALNEARELLQLLTADSRLHIGDLQVVAKVAVYILMIIPLGQLAELTVEAVMAEVVLSGGADAVPAPVPVAQDQPVQLGIVGVDTAALPHGHVVGRIEAGGADVAPGAGIAGLTVDGVLGAQGVAVVLHQPQLVLVAERLHFLQVKGVSQGMGDHHRLGLIAESRFQFAHIDVILRNCDIHKNGDRAVLQGRGHGGGEAAGHGNDLVALLDLTPAQLGGSQRHKGDQVGGGAAVYQMGVLHADPRGKFLLELLCEAAGGQPEVQHGVRQCAHFLFVKYPGRVGNAVTLPVGGFLFFEIVVIIRN